ncbi:hypothetical protein [Phenylobacterium sp. J367]|uniref:hypothetical protein n=1 Tax=Phenylobacterium sp. J367 TaxID=2898435 RepID=UPI002150CD36|nr:hypothetical protein [Phenylobacterium sp. J367]MCR5880334.1 hypothetical protein [Phenylobacterium sp. J367]
MRRSATDVRTFGPTSYEVLDEDLATLGEVVIWSVSPLPPALGELFTIESEGAVHEVAVSELTTFEGGWSARCRTVAWSI